MESELKSEYGNAEFRIAVMKEIDEFKRSLHS